MWTGVHTLTLEQGCCVTVQFYTGLEGNELADTAVNTGYKLPLQDSGLSFSSVKSLIHILGYNIKLHPKSDTLVCVTSSDMDGRKIIT